MFQLSRERAMNRGYWNLDPGDDLPIALQDGYGEEEVQPRNNDGGEPEQPDDTEEDETGTDPLEFINADEDIQYVYGILSARMDLYSDDGNWGLYTYKAACIVLAEYLLNKA
jgi:hypothetical protein